jgi:peptide/nickel transport system permease protein
MTLSLLKNLARAVAVFLVVTFITFCMMYGNATGIAHSVLGISATPEEVQAEVVKLGLNKPLVVQYLDWLKGVVTGNLGQSFYTGQSVSDALAHRVPVTLSLVIITLLLTAVLSVIFGVTAAVRGGWTDRVLQFTSVLGTAIPGFIVAIVLVFLFAIHWPILPATGYVTPAQSVTGWAKSLTLPVLALLIGAVAGAAQQFRTAMLDTLGRDYIRTLRARGIGEREIVFRNALRNAAAPGLTVLSLTLFGLLGGAVFIEQIFALPGMGQLANASAQTDDVPMVMGCVLVTVVIVLIVNFLGDLGITLLNPKARIK